MFIRTKIGRNTVTIAITFASMLSVASAFAGRATGLPHYTISAPVIIPVPDEALSPPRLSNAERLVRLETEVQVLKVCLKNMATPRASQCVL